MKMSLILSLLGISHLYYVTLYTVNYFTPYTVNCVYGLRKGNSIIWWKFRGHPLVPCMAKQSKLSNFNFKSNGMDTIIMITKCIILTANTSMKVMVYRQCNKLTQPIDHHCYSLHLQCNKVQICDMTDRKPIIVFLKQNMDNKHPPSRVLYPIGTPWRNKKHALLTNLRHSSKYIPMLAEVKIWQVQILSSETQQSVQICLII